nr:glycosyltransferase [Clostridia bacterium]
ILSVAAPFDERKGYADTLAAAKALPQYRFVLVGLTEKQVQSLPEGVQGMTRTENAEELIRLYQRADALLNTTYEDTYPTVNMEAMACGTPVASYATGGCCEQIPETCGTLTPTGDMPRLIEALRRVVEAGRASYSRACRDHAVERFDRHVSQELYVREYDALWGKADARPK